MEPPAPSSVEIKPAEPNTLILDNGSHQLRLGFKDSAAPLRIAPNCAVKTKNNKHRLIGEELEQFVGDLSGLVYRRPFDKGYLINWDLQKEIWDFEHAQKRINERIDPSSTKLLMTEPLFTPDILTKISDQVLFEEYGFESVLTASAPGLSWLHHQSTQKSPSPCGLVVDVGYSFTHIVPFYDNHLINYGVKRINVGGKLLTNYLKEIISYRYYNMMEETFLINIIKEKLCYVSQNFLQDLAATKRRDNKIRREYVLPDYALNKYGYIKGEESPPAGYDPKDEQILVMNNERITVPEILFNPSDIGIYQAGVPETIVQSVESLHRDMHPAMYSNIVLMGGCTQFKGFKERLEKELRALVPAEYPLHITMPDNPSLTAWQGGKLLANQPDFDKRAVTKAEYSEYGHVICKRKFGLL